MGAIGLEHEQMHFDIAEVYTRIIRSGIKEMVRKKEVSVEGYIELIENGLVLIDKRDSTFDNQTSHGTNVAVQQKWRERINFELDSFHSMNQVTKDKNSPQQWRASIG